MSPQVNPITGVARPESSSFLATIGGSFAFGANLVVETPDTAVFTRDGRVLGTVGPGRHALDPTAAPFLGMMVDGGVLRGEIHFVAMSVIALEFGKSLTMTDTVTGNVVRANVFGEMRVQVVDAIALVSLVAGQSDAGEGLLQLIRAALADGIAAAASSEQQSTRRPLAVLLTEGLSESAKEAACQFAARVASGALRVSLDSLSASFAQDEAQAPDDTFEMLWACRHCGKRGLLGLTHRHCPNCGAPQDASSRYFPSEEEKVAVRNHPYVGVDMQCGSCKSYSSRSAKCCGNCGAPLDRAADIQLRPDEVRPEFGGAPSFAHGGPAAQALAPAPSAKGQSGGLIVGIAVAVALLFGGCIFALTRTKHVAGLEVTGRTWLRTIDVEKYNATRASAWCDELPSGAHELARHKEHRGTTKVKDGEDCQKRKKDQGDGTFKEVRECTPRYKEKPVDADRCDYERLEWKTDRTARVDGNGFTDPPAWPKVTLGRTGSCLGCEREGKRAETYTVSFLDPKDKKERQCTTDAQRWASFAKGSRWDGDVSAVMGTVDCSSLKAR